MINTQDVFRSALVPALLFLGAALAVALLWRRRPQNGDPARADRPAIATLDLGALLGGSLILVGVGALLFGVALGWIYAVEAAATGAIALLALGLATGRLGRRSIEPLLTDVLVTTGVLFAPLIAATSFTLVLRLLGTDKLIERFIVGLPVGPTTAVIVVLLMIAASAVVLDAFEIVFVMVPILAPPLLMRVPDAAWVAVLLLLTLQASFLVPPIGYALSMARSTAAEPARLGRVVRALMPYLAAQLAVLTAVLAAPSLVHMLDPKPPTTAGPAVPGATRQQSQDRMIEGLPPRTFGVPQLPTSPPPR